MLVTDFTVLPQIDCNRSSYSSGFIWSFYLIVYFRTSGLQRSAGDVLNDIGSMLADLTDELDAMLHMEAKQS